MKKAFTLIEMIIVITIISILLGAMSFLSWNYIKKLNLQKDKETILNSFFDLQTTSLSQPQFGKFKNISYVGIKLKPQLSYVSQIALSGDLQTINPFTIGIKNLSYLKMGTGILLFSGNNLEKTITNISYLLYKPYNMGAIFVENNAGTYNIYTGNYTIKFKYYNHIYNVNYCFKLNLLSGRLYSQNCDF